MDVSGRATNVVQARNVRDVHFHGPSPYQGKIALPCLWGAIPDIAPGYQPRASTTALPTTSGCAVVFGTAGVGKTQLVAEYAHREWNGNRVGLLAWITATSRADLVSGYAALAQTLTGREDPDLAIRILFSWFATTDTRWLVVLDDIWHPQDIESLWPPSSPAGRTIATTRRQDAAFQTPGRSYVELGLFTPEQSRACLEERLRGRRDLLRGVRAIGELVSHLPLAIGQVAAYIADRSLTCEAYAARWNDRRRTLKDLFPPQTELLASERAVATTWALSVDRANELAPRGVAGKVLDIAAVLDANGIPESALVSAAVAGYTGTGATRDDLSDALGCLTRLSLVIRTGQSGQVRVHSLTQRATLESMAPGDRATCIQVAADTLLEVWPETDPAKSPSPNAIALAEVLRANATALAEVAGPALWTRGGHDVLFQVGNSLGDAGQHEAAADYFRDLHSTATEHLGPGHPRVLMARYKMAYWQAVTGEDGAIGELQQILAEQERVLGAGDPDALSTRHDIIHLQAEAGETDTAITSGEELLARLTDLLGREHPDTLTLRHNIAHWRAESGDIGTALAELDDILADHVSTLGPHDAGTLSTRYNIAHWRARSGDVTTALDELRQLLPLQVDVLGPHHPDTLNTRHNIAHWRARSGDVTTALDELQRLLPDQTRVLGYNNPATKTTRGYIAYLQYQLR
ncbi:tetratricopeptide repeat protein [Actinokineospora sp. PR83]|uniref:tetratricopeptide repeat protein n=1 Tax=Actinokineospora sp. PR83 TaxID=2884908 RepID=UPI001F38CCB5|nr:tetratricopeptide repeat protein [Actinokineospora sp. PR83]MCG8914956.1 tetratricopeptide repeat protein [Actinokineospora sp. PR83]